YVVRFVTTGTAADHAIQVRVQGEGSQGTDKRTVHYPTVPPTVKVVRPSAGAVVQGEVELVPAFGAALQRQIARVEYRTGGALIGPADTPPFTFTWSTATLAPGAYTVEVRAVDTDGLAGTDRVTLTVTAAAPPSPVPTATTASAPPSGASAPQSS